ncbi:PP0621 family protein [Dechloromonas hortensis]|uniref:PP0621 family protein n=1 Tax=Dechloromonas hortensis TaxID=337779 RepID=UPI001292014C|nr:PP0621 family protein [Dechloromonas hortensis]
MKYLLLFAVLAVVWWVWKKRQRQSERPAPRPDPKVENMLVCAHCGVHFPEGDGVRDEGEDYCCAAHRSAARPGSR